MRKTNSLFVVLIAVAGCFACAACAPAGGALSEQHFAAGSTAARRIPATVALVQGPDTQFVVQNCGSPGSTCPMELEPGLTASVKSMLAANFEDVKSAPDEASAAKQADLVAVQDVATSPAVMPGAGMISIKLTFRDPISQKKVGDVSHAGQIIIPPKSFTGEDFGLLLLTVATLDMALPLDYHVWNEEQAAIAQQALDDSMPPVMKDLSDQIVSDPRFSSFVPLRAKLVAAKGDEQAGMTAESEGRFDEALHDYTAALNAIPPEQALDIDLEIRARVFTAVSRMEPRPQLPEEYRREMMVGLTAVQEAKHPEDYEHVLEHFRAAANAAPWAAQPYYNMGLVYKELKDNDAALRNLNLCVMAAPDGADAGKAHSAIAALEVKPATEAITPVNAK